MAPRAPEPREHVLGRLQRIKNHPGAAEPRGDGEVLRFGSPHCTHAVTVEAGTWRIRRLVVDPAEATAYLAEHGIFMPEHAETISKPGPKVILEARSLGALITALAAGPWPLR